MSPDGRPVRLDDDHHVHTTFSDDAVSTVQENLAAAAARGLRSVRLVDHVRESTRGVEDRVAAYAAARVPDGLVVLTGIEAKILDVTGRIDAPHDALVAVGGRGGVDRVLLADHQVPGPDGPWSPRATRERLDAGLPPGDVVTMLVTATVAALRTGPPAQLAHLFSVLPKIGLSEDDVTDEHLAELAAAVRAADAVVEVNEKWRCPGPRVVDHLRAAGVALVASTDAHAAADVGVYRWLADDEATGTTGGTDGTDGGGGR